MGIRNSLVLLFVLLLISCPAKERTDDTKQSNSTSKSTEQLSDVDCISAGLRSAVPQVRYHALVAITLFELDRYHDEMVELSKTDVIAAVAMSALTADTGFTVEFLKGKPVEENIEPILGAVLGLSVADELESEYWLSLINLSQDSEDGLNSLLWGMAQLDVDPSGPIKINEDLALKLAELHQDTFSEDNRYRRGALDALLGNDDTHSIDWNVYIKDVSISSWNSTQWSALLRWAPSEVWADALVQPKDNDQIRIQLGHALIISGPDDVELPGGSGRWISLGLGPEYRVNQAMLIKEPVFAPEVNLLSAKEGENPHIMEVSDDDVSVLASLLDLSLARGQRDLMDRILAEMPNYHDKVRYPVIATIARRNPDLVTDEQLRELMTIHNNSHGYLLIKGWYDREPIQDNGLIEFMMNSPDAEDNVLAFGFKKWLDARKPNV